MDDVERLLGRSRDGDAEARRALVERAGLRVARVAIGGSTKDRADAVRELVRGEGATPGLEVLLAAIALYEDDGELRRALEAVHRAGGQRWGPPERAAVGAIVGRHGARLGAELALDVLGWAAGYPEDPADFVRGTAPALAAAHAEQIERFGWHRGFQAFVVRDREHVVAWSARPELARQIAKALLSAHAAGAPGVIAALDAIWSATPDRGTWAAALAEAVRGSSGMRGRDEIIAWSWRRFCDHPDERRALYAAFEPWRTLWIEQRDAMPAHARPGGASARAHLELWGGLSIEHLAAVVEEVDRLARDDEWPALVDATFDLGAHATPRRHALAGVCRIASKVANRIRNGATAPGIDAAGDRVIARGEALARELRERGEVIDEIIANRAADLELEARLIREHRERLAEHARRDADRERAAAEHAAAIAAEQARIAEARRAAEEARIRAELELQARLPRVAPEPIDDEIFFAALPAAPTLLAYARLFKRLSSGHEAVKSLAAEGVGLEMIAVINQTWAALFAQRPDLALRFSTLISSPTLT